MVADVTKFITAGNAVFTLTSKTSGRSFTYQVQHKAGKPWFVSVLTGPDNTSDYTFIGTIFAQEAAQQLAFPFTVFRHSKKSPVGADALSVKAFQWFWDHLFNHGRTPDGVEFRHEGRCGRCGRRLTTPESVDRGLGPECAERNEE